MCSLEVYNKFRGKLNQILTEGESLMEEDELFIDLISKSENLRDVLDLAKDMKEVGNDFFKQESIEDALEKYGYAGIILGCFQFDEDVDRLEFFDMGKCILLNSAACFSKKMEYGMVCRLCSIILEFNPCNVKALFRRAMTALELGRSDLAYWDLFMASHQEPKTQRYVGSWRRLNVPI
ncbi:uncharacterized protein [Spinacia oleracea]|uniref:Uncharacterized protein n=1 Tax=Spinacia oleracea TaxID=3562 RepID=A0ABM3R9D5_SPIOL|nr:uncharacterized protein LOC130467669 [Spinacia oleracea]